MGQGFLKHLRKYHSNPENSGERAVTDCRSTTPMSSSLLVRWAIAALLLGTGTGAFASGAPLYDSIRLNIGLNCRWERTCIAAQTRAMNRALSYVKARHPSQPLLHLCNRNAKRSRYRVDWIGFENCIRNPRLASR